MSAIEVVMHAARSGPAAAPCARRWGGSRRAGASAFARPARGLSLIEALVALVVLSVGLLGIAALYAESLLSVRTSLQRSQAALLASDLAERIRANRGGRPAYVDAVSGAGALTTACRQGGGGCPPEQMARYDKAEWAGAIKASLPNGTGAVEAGGPARRAYTITIRWTEPAMGGQTYVLSIQP